MANTSLIGLLLPSTGTLSGQWGGAVNNAISEIVDAAVAGTQTISTDADVDLSVTVGTYASTGLTSTSSQYAVLLCTGARTAARYINTPKQSKTYVVINDTTGGYAVTVRGGPTSPTTGVTVAAGTRAIIAWNGSDFVNVGGGSAAGSNTQVQFNDNGSFGADAYFTYNNVTHTVQVGGNLIANSLQIGSGGYKWSTSLVYFASTMSTTPQQVLYSIPVENISGVEFEIIATEPAGPSRQSCKISSLYYDGTVQYNEYASLFVNGGVGNFEVDYNAGNLITPPSLELKVSPNTVNTVTYKMLITQYAN